MLTCFHLKKGRATFFRPETIVKSFLHLMVLFFKVLLKQPSLTTEAAVVACGRLHFRDLRAVSKVVKWDEKWNWKEFKWKHSNLSCHHYLSTNGDQRSLAFTEIQLLLQKTLHLLWQNRHNLQATSKMLFFSAILQRFTDTQTVWYNLKILPKNSHRFWLI